MGFSPLLLISEEESRPYLRPDKEEKFMFRYSKKTATVTNKGVLLGD